MADLNQLLATAQAAHDAGRLAEAERAYRQVLQLQPRHAEALHGLGFLAHQIGRHEDAIRLMEQSIAADPSAPEYHHNLAGVLDAIGRAEAAAEHYRRAVAMRPDFFEAWCNLGVILRKFNRTEEAAECFRKATAINPASAHAHNDLGGLLGKLGRWKEAEACFRRAIQNSGSLASAHSNLGTALRCQGRLDEAAQAFRKAAELRPDSADVYTNLGNVLSELGRFDEAAGMHRKAVQLNPLATESWYGLGLAFRKLVLFDEAEDAYRRAVEIRPDYAEAHNNLAGVLRDQWQLDEAIEHLRRAIAIRPDYAQAHSNLLFNLHYHPKHSPESIFEEHLNWARQHGAGAIRQMGPHANNRDPGRRLRIGYLSPDLRSHSVAFFFEPILENHDRRDHEIICYSSTVSPDAVTERLRARADGWREVLSMSESRVAEQIYADRIDVLIELAGHTADRRLLAMAYKPAPVQMTYLGYPATTGLAAVDYRMTDALCDPPGMTEAYHTERLLRLDGCFLCYRPPEDAPAVAELPARANGFVTFGCFNSIVKVTIEMLRNWSKILRLVPGSKLILKDKGLASARTRGRMLAALAAEGVSSDRVELRGPEPSLRQHLSIYGSIDVALDTFPYCGTTTTCEALWMGAPVVSLAGRLHASRVGCSLLNAAGLSEWVASGEEDYVTRAARLASDLDALGQRRESMRTAMLHSPLLDGVGFTRKLEIAYRRAWTAWCTSGPDRAL